MKKRILLAWIYAQTVNSKRRLLVEVIDRQREKTVLRRSFQVRCVFFEEIVRGVGVFRCVFTLLRLIYFCSIRGSMGSKGSWCVFWFDACYAGRFYTTTKLTHDFFSSLYQAWLHTGCAIAYARKKQKKMAVESWKAFLLSRLLGVVGVLGVVGGVE